MKKKVSLDAICKPSEDVVAREVQGEFIIIPITSGIADLEDEIFALNKTGQAVWNRLDGKKSVGEIVKDLEELFEVGRGQIEKDVVGITGELLARRMLVEVK